VTVRFASPIGAEVKAALGEGRKALQQGKVTAVVDLTWDETTTLTITAPSEIYIAGRLMDLAGESAGPLDGQHLVRR
jgi:hypothetical protein